LPEYGGDLNGAFAQKFTMHLKLKVPIVVNPLKAGS
jgi:hypothetical protein